jgi:hypothetical protein
MTATYWNQKRPSAPASSKTKYEPHLNALSMWSKERDVADLSTQLIKFEFLPHWLDTFFLNHDREPAVACVPGFRDYLLPLVSTRNGGPLHTSYIWRIVKRVAGRASVRLHGRDESGR